MTGARAMAMIELNWHELAMPLANAEDALARLDERLANSPIREGWIERTHFADAFAAVDAALASANRTVADDRVQQARRERDPLAHDPDWDEDARLDEWFALMEETLALPAMLEAAIPLDAWETIAPLEREAWLGRLLVASRLGSRGKTRAHLPCLHDGFRAIPFERRRTRDPTMRLAVAGAPSL